MPKANEFFYEMSTSNYMCFFSEFVYNIPYLIIIGSVAASHGTITSHKTRDTFC